MTRITALTGGIGAGKSTIARVLRTWGYPVYDCDSRARCIMDEDDGIKRRIAEEIDLETVVDDIIDRAKLSEIVFSDKEKLSRLNSIVHAAVRADLRRWAAESDSDRVFVETAILYSSGLCHDINNELRVTASVETRIERVMRRNGFSRSHIEARIASQAAEENPADPVADVFILDNGGAIPVLPRLHAYLSR